MWRFVAISAGLTILACQVNSQVIKSPLNLLGLPLSEAIEAQRNYIEVPRPYFNGPRTYIDAPRPYLEIPNEGIRNYINLPRVIEGPNYIPQSIIDPIGKVLPVNIPPCVPSTAVISECNPSVCKYLTDTINLLVVSNLLANKLGGEQLAIPGPFIQDVSRSFANANFGPLVAPNLVAPNVIAPNYVSQNLVAPNVVAPPNFSSAPVNKGALVSSLLNILNGASL